MPGHQAVEHLDHHHLGAEARQTEPSSSPMAPPPMTSSRSGTRGSDSASVEEMMRAAVERRPGSSIGALPVAIRMLLGAQTSAARRRCTSTRSGGDEAAGAA